MTREAVARIINPEAWEAFERDGGTSYWMVTDSLVRADAILTLGTLAQGVEGAAMNEPRRLEWYEAMQIVERGFDAWAAKPHNAKWFRRIDGTPIRNDLIVCIATEVAAATRSPVSEALSLASAVADKPKPTLGETKPIDHPSRGPLSFASPLIIVGGSIIAGWFIASILIALWWGT